jgi:hypothetical protein
MTLARCIAVLLSACSLLLPQALSSQDFSSIGDYAFNFNDSTEKPCDAKALMSMGIESGNSE